MSAAAESSNGEPAAVAQPSDAAPRFDSLAKRGLPELIAEQIVEAIRTTPLHPGDRLPPEADLAHQLGVGRTSVREALQKLQTLGIVEVIRGRGAFVREPSSDDDAERGFAKWTNEHAVAIEDLIEARIAIETSTAGLAAVRATDEQKRAIAELNDAHRDAGRRRDLADMVATDERFHSLIAEASDNPLLAKINSMLSPEVTSFRRMTLAVPRVAERSAAAHELIVKAISKTQPDAARAAMIDHLWALYEDVEGAASSGPTRRRAAPLAAPREALF
jgi:GntR family transcriptional repressor for pyruvate dehydrogenase complex